MAYDASLASRIDELIKNKKSFSRKEMFGGLGYLYNGNMCVGIHKNDLIVRFPPDQTSVLMKQKHVKPFNMTGRSMKGWLLVAPEGFKDSGLEKWFNIAFGYVQSLPSKK